MKWIVALVAAVLLALAMPFAIKAAKATARGKGHAAGMVLAIGLAFAFTFDPVKAAAIEQAKQGKVEMGDEDAEGEPLD